LVQYILIVNFKLNLSWISSFSFFKKLLLCKKLMYNIMIYSRALNFKLLRGYNLPYVNTCDQHYKKYFTFWLNICLAIMRSRKHTKIGTVKKYVSSEMMSGQWCLRISHWQFVGLYWYWIWSGSYNSVCFSYLICIAWNQLKIMQSI
jgi:hypothetical protein